MIGGSTKVEWRGGGGCCGRCGSDGDGGAVVLPPFPNITNPFSPILHHYPPFSPMPHHFPPFPPIPQYSPTFLTIPYPSPPFPTIPHHSPPFPIISHHYPPFPTENWVFFSFSSTTILHVGSGPFESRQSLESGL